MPAGPQGYPGLALPSVSEDVLHVYVHPPTTESEPVGVEYRHDTYTK